LGPPAGAYDTISEGRVRRRVMPSSQRVAARDLDDLARHPPGLFTGEQQYDVRDVLWRAQTTHAERPIAAPRYVEERARSSSALSDLPSFSDRASRDRVRVHEKIDG